MVFRLILLKAEDIREAFFWESWGGEVPKGRARHFVEEKIKVGAGEKEVEQEEEAVEAVLSMLGLDDEEVRERTIFVVGEEEGWG